MMAVFVGGHVGGAGDDGKPCGRNDDDRQAEGGEGEQGGDESRQHVAWDEDAEAGEVMVFV